MNRLSAARRMLPRAALVMILAGCAGGEPTTDASVSGSGAPVQPMLRFNDLDGGSPTIQVYPGTSDSAADKIYNGTYKDGEERPVQCHQVGRIVISHTDLGEQYRQSSDWYRLAGPEAQYATAVYGDIVPSGAAVREC